MLQRLVLILAITVGFGASQLGCPGTGPGAVVGNTVINCTLANQDQITSLIGEFKTLLSGQLPNWSAIYARAKQAGSAIGGCALAETVQNYLGNRTAPPPQADSWTAAAALERFRREEAGNKTFHTAQGDL